MFRIAIPLLASLASLALNAHGASVLHYWDMDTLDAGVPQDVVGGLGMSAGSNLDLAHTAYTAAGGSGGNYLKTTLADYDIPLLADVYNGSPTAVIFAGDFSLSYWIYDDTTDEDVRGMRTFDAALPGAVTAAHLGTQLMQCPEELAWIIRQIFRRRPQDGMPHAVVLDFIPSTFFISLRASTRSVLASCFKMTVGASRSRSLSSSSPAEYNSAKAARGSFSARAESRACLAKLRTLGSAMPLIHSAIGGSPGFQAAVAAKRARQRVLDAL